ncbi:MULTISPECIES: NUDIX domain-containing protein [Actinomadura]|uniref:NUDIX domain-containing protein n=1 Tax=Actinomadura litoris TaxID=2678616 RepID=A0A7K1L1F2_9ACTN|nr:MULTISPECIES: NUDIX domain-containing protein [Actinomadura]MBT2206669.1 NUDIX hydrolase [Actinomadura sp. NEAU-AAG7]MUN38231.1 NUDIX domain-containing protein [Actinomadura litoris]
MAEPVHAAGAVLWRDGPEFAVIHRPRYDDWSFPKGKVDKGEHVLRAAVREIEEETGVPARLGRRLPTVRYPVDGRPKQVDYWSARGVGESAFAVNDEVDRLVWLPAAEAEARLSYRHDVDLLHDFLRGPLTTWPLVILRHGSAGEKHAWHEPDELRPLDGKGRAEASELAALLHAYGPSRPLSSATARCVETVLPYARLVRTPITTDAAFTVGETDADRAMERVLEIVAEGLPTVLCTHGEVVSDLVTGLCKELGENPPDDPGLRKSEFWVVHLDGSTIASLERHTPLRRTGRASATR